MNGDQYRERIGFISRVKVGDIVESRFTNSGEYHQFKSRITKVNSNTVRVVRCDGKSVYEGDDQNREFIVYIDKSSNNCILPFKCANCEGENVKTGSLEIWDGKCPDCGRQIKC